MAKRFKMGRRNSRKAFKKGYNRVHPKNRWTNYFMRGGIRL